MSSLIPIGYYLLFLLYKSEFVFLILLCNFSMFADTVELIDGIRQILGMSFLCISGFHICWTVQFYMVAA